MSRCDDYYMTHNTLETIDTSDESLMRYHYVSIAEQMGIARRPAEVKFRTDWYIIRRLGTHRPTVMDEIRKLLRRK